MELTKEIIGKFLKERPKLTKAGLSEEAGFSPRYLSLILDDDKPLTEPMKKGLLPVMRRYGYLK